MPVRILLGIKKKKSGKTELIWLLSKSSESYKGDTHVHFLPYHAFLGKEAHPPGTVGSWCALLCLFFFQPAEELGCQCTVYLVQSRYKLRNRLLCYPKFQFPMAVPTLMLQMQYFHGISEQMFQIGMKRCSSIVLNVVLPINDNVSFQKQLFHETPSENTEKLVVLP